RKLPAVRDRREFPHAAILRELAGRDLAGRVKVTRRDGGWCWRVPLAGGGEAAGRAVWVDGVAAWVVSEVVLSQPVVPDTLAPVVAGWEADRMPVPVSPAPARVVSSPVVPARVAAALARVSARPVPVVEPQPVVVAPVAPVVEAVAPVVVSAVGEHGRYAYAPGTRVRAVLRDVRRDLAAAVRVSGPLAGVSVVVEADRPTVARPTGYVVVRVEVPAGADVSAVWAAIDRVVARHVPAFSAA
ncbi:hypothetical protein ABT336_11750, partial [Micromonospora sp. NPDC000207]|uniref:hypothetical protein n=1 Tax=Micromonospora sp. NPDC000207 TaxID=3154246 RepID=UPI00331BFDC7